MHTTCLWVPDKPLSNTICCENNSDFIDFEAHLSNKRSETRV